LREGIAAEARPGQRAAEASVDRRSSRV